MKLQIIPTADGSQTVYFSEMDEQYHSVRGAVTESGYVYIERGFLFNECAAPTVFEVGFGTGLNCLLTALAAEKSKRPTTYFTIEKFPLDKNICEKLTYGKNISVEAHLLFQKIHLCKWGQPVQISPWLNLVKLKSDLLENDLSEVPGCDVIYFDAFAPDKQPEMWHPGILKKIHSVTADNGVFVTYSAKGSVRRQLKACGFEMKRLPGPPGKFHMMRGIKRKPVI